MLVCSKWRELIRGTEGDSDDSCRVPPGYEKSWNLGRPFSRPGKSWKIAKVMENDDNVMVFLQLH